MTNKTKKILSLSITIICIFVFTIPAFSSQTTASTVYGDSVNGTAGEYVDIPVKIADNTGFMGFSINIEYDAAVLTPVSIESGTVTSNGGMENSIETSQTNKFLVTWYNSENTTLNGTLFVMRFKIAEKAIGKTEIGISYNQADTFNEDWQNVVFECSNIELIIANSTVENNTSLTVSDITTIAGAEFEMVVNAKNISLTDSFTYQIPVDAAKYSYISFTDVQGNVNITKNSDNIVVSWNDTNNNATDGTLFKIKFKAAEYTAYEGDIVPTLVEASSTVMFLDFSISITNPYENNPAEIYCNTVRAGVGKTVEIPVLIRNNHGIMGFVIDFKYDTNVFTLQSVAKGSSIKNGFFDYNEKTSGTVEIAWSGTQNITENVILFIVTLKVNDNATPWTQSTISLDYDQTQTFDENWKDVTLKTSNTNLSIIIYGDVNKDNVFNETDYQIVVSTSVLETELSSEQKTIADVNNDGAVDGFDAIILDLQLNL